jgi:tetratricopeptide (TPR) repeat protein
MRNRIFITLLFFALMAPALSVKAQAQGANEGIERGNELFFRGQYELAIFEYRTALSWPGGHEARARFNIGVCHYKLGRRREAVAEYRAAIKFREGRFPSASYALGVALQELGRYPEAREAFGQAVESSGGKHAEALFELALESQRAGDDRAAVNQYRRAIAQSLLISAPLLPNRSRLSKLNT